jgi:putative ABC transport system permease protein
MAWVRDLHSIAMTESLATRHGVGVGDTIRLSTPSGVETLTVRGLLRAEGIARAFGGRLVIMDLFAAQALFARGEQIDQLDVVLRPGANVGDVQARLEQKLAPALTVATPMQRSAQYESILSAFQAMLGGLSLLCLVAGIYIIYNTTSTGAVHRALAMAGLRLIGADPRRLFSLLIVEALALGVLGALVGVPTGIVLARALIEHVSNSMGVIFQLQFHTETLAVDVPNVIVIGAVGITAAVFASWFPARRIAALEPLEVMRADLRSLAVQPDTGRLTLWWLALVLVSAGALVLEVRLKSIAWGNFGSTLWFASSIVIAIPVVSMSARLLSGVLSRIAGAEGRVAAASLFHSLTRTGVTVAAVTLVLTVAIMLASLTVSFQ